MTPDSSGVSATLAVTTAIDMACAVVYGLTPDLGDGIATEWSSAGDGDDAWITIDLGEPVDVVGIGFHSRQMGDGTSIVESFTVTVDDGAELGPFQAGPGMSQVDLEITGQVLRFDAAETTGGNTGAIEIEVYR